MEATSRLDNMSRSLTCVTCFEAIDRPFKSRPLISDHICPRQDRLVIHSFVNLKRSSRPGTFWICTGRPRSSLKRPRFVGFSRCFGHVEKALVRAATPHSGRRRFPKILKGLSRSTGDFNEFMCCYGQDHRQVDEADPGQRAAGRSTPARTVRRPSPSAPKIVVFDCSMTTLGRAPQDGPQKAVFDRAGANARPMARPMTRTPQDGRSPGRP